MPDRRSAREDRWSVQVHCKRYASRQDYLQRYGQAPDELVKQRWILENDRETLLRRAAQD